MNNAAVGVLANYAWNLGLDGTGVAVAVIDSGVHGVDDLKDATGKNRILYNFDSLGGGSLESEFRRDAGRVTNKPLIVRRCCFTSPPWAAILSL